MIAGIQALTAGLSNVALITPSNTVGYQGIQINPNGTGQAIFPIFLFHTEGENRMELRTDITDHYVENNTAIQDHAAFPPIKVMVHGFIGELNDLLPLSSPVIAAINAVLAPIDVFAPNLSITAQNALNNANSAYTQIQNAANAAVSAWNSLAAQGTQNKQQAAFQWWANARLQRWLFNVQTPWCVMRNMMPESIVPVQPEDSVSITDFFITFKEMRFADTTSTPVPVFSGRAADSASSVVDLGTSTPSASTSVAAGLAGVVGGG